MLVDVFCEVGSDQIVVSIFGVQPDLPMEDVAEGNIHIVLNFSEEGLITRVHIKKNILKAKGGVLSAINKNY
jgi:hypothetical protein